MNEVERLLSRPKTGKKERATSATFRELARTSVEAILEKKGRDVLVMDMQGVSGVADVFVLCTGDSDLQIKAIADAVQDRIRERHAERPWHVEGYEFRQWVLLDYVDLVVHVFLEERRAFYGLERLWGDAPREEVVDTGSTPHVRLLDDPSVSSGGGA